MSDMIARLRALSIEPGEAACDYELRAQESNLIPRLSCDAALAELMTALEEERDLRLRVEAEADRVCSLEQGAAECAEKRAERAEAERNALQHIIDCADTPLMRDVMAARDRAKAKLTRSETAFGILSDLYPDEAQEAWRKAGELCEGAK